MRVKKFLSSTFMTPADVEEAGGGLSVTLQDVEQVELRDGAKLMVVFEGEHPGLVLNQTNIRTLVKAYGDDSERLGGQGRSSLFLIDVEVQGEMKRGIRIRPPRTVKASTGAAFREGSSRRRNPVLGARRGQRRAPRAGNAGHCAAAGPALGRLALGEGQAHRQADESPLLARLRPAGKEQRSRRPGAPRTPPAPCRASTASATTSSAARGLAALDEDACRDPASGVLLPWAANAR